MPILISLRRAGGTGPALAGPILCHYGLFSYANLLLAEPTFAMVGPIKSCFRWACYDLPILQSIRTNIKNPSVIIYKIISKFERSTVNIIHHKGKW